MGSTSFQKGRRRESKRKEEKENEEVYSDLRYNSDSMEMTMDGWSFIWSSQQTTFIGSSKFTSIELDTS